MKRAIVFINGKMKGKKEFYLKYIQKEDKVFCADGGAKHTYNLGLMPELILGDFDSISKEVLSYYQNKGVELKKYPSEKDKTDTQLLLELLSKRGFQKVIIFAGLGGGLDHILGNLYLLEKFSELDLDISLVTPSEIIEVITEQKVIKDQQNKRVSFSPLTSKATGIDLTGFKYQLKNGVMVRGNTLGLGNFIVEKEATVKLKTGKLLMIIRT
ncbi:thiamine diphosphokinase [Natroniella sulfidigena]|uniref:thiamine diphosphokinase n=1 Tax=Natroniella sulfidigena TaxID=723921 RepID=UPI00200A9009|nr:thiamine diphosphokinase [Natroniella sulfidigena]MCK8817273.1 thiamine diphosphokinase [Natroniella sulfidigena]